MRIITTRGVVWHDNKLLCVLHKKGEGTNDFWCLPGGKLLDNEALIDGLIREMIEETDIAPTIGQLLYVQQYQESGIEFLEFFFHIQNAADYQHIDLTQASHGELEIAEWAFVDPPTTNVMPKFLQSLDFARDIAQTQPTQFYNNLEV